MTEPIKVITTHDFMTNTKLATKTLQDYDPNMTHDDVMAADLITQYHNLVKSFQAQMTLHDPLTGEAMTLYSVEEETEVIEEPEAKIKTMYLTLVVTYETVITHAHWVLRQMIATKEVDL